MSKTNSTNYKDWLEKAEHDLEDAKKLLQNGGYTDTICFHAQQAVEKYLKAYLIYKKINPGRSIILKNWLKIAQSSIGNS